MKRVVCYCRVSTEEEKQLNALQKQVEELEPSLVYELGSGTEDEKGFIGTILEAYTSNDFKALRDDPVSFAEQLRRKIDESQRARNEFEF